MYTNKSLGLLFVLCYIHSKQGQESFYFGQHTTKNVVASISFYDGGSGRAGEGVSDYGDLEVVVDFGRNVNLTGTTTKVRVRYNESKGTVSFIHPYLENQ